MCDLLWADPLQDALAKDLKERVCSNEKLNLFEPYVFGTSRLYLMGRYVFNIENLTGLS